MYQNYFFACLPLVAFSMYLFSPREHKDLFCHFSLLYTYPSALSVIHHVLLLPLMQQTSKAYCKLMSASKEK